MSAASDAPRKRSRRRLRLSCVECARRRQKCDREKPCAKCMSRGIGHLCRWELEPFARPSPARPPVASSGTEIWTAGKPSSRSVSPTRNVSPVALVSVDREVKEAAIALAQLSVARHGEYLGTGSLVCALHKLDDSAGPQLVTDKSSGLPFFTSSEYSNAISNTFINSLQNLIAEFPDKFRCDALLTSFFERENWYLGLPQALTFSLYNGMWDTIRADLTSLTRINFHWVTFLFAVFALSPECTSEEESKRYFLQALTGKRLAEDLLCSSFVSPRVPGLFNQGTAHGCIAAALIAKFMCDRGQMTEAWKLLGSALRNAQNSGLHLDPAWSRWEDMNDDEQYLRSLAWHLCSWNDKFLSFVLGRPVMVRARDCDVPLLKAFPACLATDGSTNTTNIYLACLSLLLDTVSEEKDKYLSVHPEASDGGAHFDGKMAAWEESLPAYFACCQPDASLDHVYPYLLMQRCMIRSFFYACCMLFHRSLPCVLPLPSQVHSDRRGTLQLRGSSWDYDKMTSHAISLLHTQRTFLANLWWQRQISSAITFLVFEAGVTLSIALLRDTDNLRVEEWRKERDGAVDMLESLRDRDYGDIVCQAILVLRVLRDSKPGKSDAALDTVDLDVTDLSVTPSISGPYWPPHEMQFASMTSTKVLQSLEVTLPPEWMADGLVSAFDLLHSL